MYALLRAAAGVALRWFYRDIQVEGVERIPRGRPTLFVVNHPNALVDALIVSWIAPQRVLITAKSTLFTNPIGARLLRWLGVVPLRRVADEGGRTDPARNLETFRAVYDALRRRSTVLIFPEGISHDEPSLAPLKTGAARMALGARDTYGVREIAIVPIGLTFERKDAPRSRVLVQVGEAIGVDQWRAPEGWLPAYALTNEIDARLRAVTLNYASADDASRAAALASVVAALFSDTPRISGNDRGLAAEAAIARRIEEIRARLPLVDDIVRARADALAHRLHDVEAGLARQGLLLEDAGISLRLRDGARFVLREGWLLAVAGPVALWGRLNHWLPFHAARAVAMRSVESAADPAMRTILAGVAMVSAAYVLQAVIVGAIAGPVVALVYLASLPVAGDLNFYLSERVARAVKRARAFLVFRRDPALQQRLRAEMASLRQESLALDVILSELREAAEMDHQDPNAMPRDARLSGGPSVA